MPIVIATSSIVSQAFRMMERDPISSLGDDSEEAQAAAEQYPLALGHCLERNDWSFASTRRSLSAAATDPFPDPVLPYLYGLPGDVIRLREVGPQFTRWRVDRDGLRANVAAPLAVRYTGRIDNEAVLPAMFQTAVSLRLAWLLGPRYLVTASKLQEIDAQWKSTLKEAMRDDARSASGARYDDLPDQGDWATEIRL